METATINATDNATETVNNSADVTLATLAAARQNAETERNTILGKLAEIDQQRQGLADRLAALNTALGSPNVGKGSSGGRARREDSETSISGQKILAKMREFPADHTFTYKDLEAFTEITRDGGHGARYHAIKRLLSDGSIIQAGRSAYKLPANA